MKENVQRYLDGEVGRKELTSDEIREAEACELLIRKTAEAYRSTEVPDLSAAVMSRLASDPQPARRKSSLALSFFATLWAPRTVRVRPAFAILTLAAMLLAVIWLPLRSEGEREGPKVFVQFRLDTSQASTVRLAGSFTQWQPSHTLQQVYPGVWTILIPLDAGVHDYAFVIDENKWIADPMAPAIDDGFGGKSSQVSVLLPPGSSQL